MRLGQRQSIAKRRARLAYIQQIAESKGGICLSKSYPSSTPQKGKLKFRCSRGHIWWARPDVVVGSWCQKCFHLDHPRPQKHTLQQMQVLAKKRGGSCISKNYERCDKKIDWCCALGHEWPATPQHIIGGRWCPMCAGGSSERLCRSLFEKITGSTFPKARPQWLKNHKGGQIELDGYNESLHIAFEYNGRQHYSPVKYFSGRSFGEQQKIDKIKRTKCKKHRVLLIEVPYTLKTEKDMLEFILLRLPPQLRGAE